MKMANQSTLTAETIIKDPFPDLGRNQDTDELVAEGKRDALAGRPRVSEATPPARFLEAKRRLRTTYQERCKMCQDELEPVENEVHKLEDSFDTLKIRTHAGAIISGFSSGLMHSKFRANIRFFRDVYETKKQDLERFKKEFDRTYDPIRGTSMSNLPLGFATATFVLIGLYLTESIFNAVLFLDATGLLGGLTISLVASLFNVVIGFLIGRYVITRMFYARLKLSKLANGLVFGGFIFLVIWLNFAIAVFRALESRGNAPLVQKAQMGAPAVNGGGLDAFTTAPMVDNFVTNTEQAIWPFANLNILDFQSALLIVTGLVFAIGALMDGYFSDDPFPGYGAKYRACLKEKAAIDGELRFYKEEFKERVTQTRSEIEALYTNAQSAIQQWSTYVNRVQRRFVDFENWVGNMNDRNQENWNAYLSVHQDNRLVGYVVPEILGIQPPALFTGNHTDPQIMFADVAYLYKTDSERSTAVKNYDSELKKAYVEMQDDLIRKIAELDANLGEIETYAEVNMA